MKQLIYEQYFTEATTGKTLDVYFDEHPEKRTQIRKLWETLGEKKLAYLWINGFKSIDTITSDKIRFCSENTDLYGARFYPLICVDSCWIDKQLVLLISHDMKILIVERGLALFTKHFDRWALREIKFAEEQAEKVANALRGYGDVSIADKIMKEQIYAKDND